MNNRHEKNPTELVENGLVSAEEIAEELLPLIEDIFVGKTVKEKNAITIALLNGQTFTVTVQNKTV